MIRMNLSIHTTVLPHDDPDASVAFYRDILGFEVRLDVQRLGVLPVDPVADAAQSREVMQAVRLGGAG